MERVQSFTESVASMAAVTMRRRRLVGALFLSMMLFGWGAGQARADGQAIVAAAQAMQSAGYPYCFGGGTVSGPTAGWADPAPDAGFPADCRTTPGKVGFDCTGLTIYAAYQGAGVTGLSHDGNQAKTGGGQVIGNSADLQPGDIVYFDYNAANGLNYIDHAGIFVGFSGGQAMVLSAVSEKWGIRTESLAWYASGGLHFSGAKRFTGNPGGGGGGGLGDGSFISYQGNVYVIAGDAPIYVSTWSAYGGARPTTALTDSQFAALRQYPADQTYIGDTTTGTVYVIAGGAPLAVSDWNRVPGADIAVQVDQAAITNAGGSGAWSHLRQYPADGTMVEGVPSYTYWIFAGGLRSPTPPASRAVVVDDAGLSAFGEAKGGAAGASGSGVGGSTAGKPPPSSTTATGAPTKPNGKPTASRHCVVPHLKGMSVARARQALLAHGCRIGAVRYSRRHRQVPRVMSQSVSPGRTRPYRSRVSIRVR